ncbi:MAG: DUF4043 family protein [Candidatus Cloacimonetes bacterium]|nr:DUF4043 family protein [Candidatus Cloacimonadota bacterium]
MDITHEGIQNVEVLETLFTKETWYNTFWSRFAGFVEISQDENGNEDVRPSGQPIEIYKGNKRKGRDNMLIPFLKQLDGDPVYGDTVLKGTEEQQEMKWLKCYVNQWRKAVEAKSGAQADQRIKIYKMYEKAKPQLQQWFSKWENQMVFQTFYEGASGNLTAAKTADGLGLKKRYHPNWYVNDDASLVAVGDEYYSKTAANLDTADTNCDTNMTSAILEELRVKCMELRIPQMVTENGDKYWVMIVHPQQANHLRQDSDFQNAQRYAFMGKGKDAPELTGLMGYYAGFAIFEDIVGVRGWTSADDDIATEGWLNIPKPGTTTNLNAIVVGRSAVGKAIATDLHFEEEKDDYNNIEGIGGAVINGYGRADFAAEDDATEDSGGLFEIAAAGGVTDAIECENQSSLILMTKSA